MKAMGNRYIASPRRVRPRNGPPLYPGYCSTEYSSVKISLTVFMLVGMATHLGNGRRATIS